MTTLMFPADDGVFTQNTTGLHTSSGVKSRLDDRDPHELRKEIASAAEKEESIGMKGFDDKDLIVSKVVIHRI